MKDPSQFDPWYSLVLSAVVAAGVCTYHKHQYCLVLAAVADVD